MIGAGFDSFALRRPAFSKDGGSQLGTRVAFAWVPSSCRSPPPFPTRGLLCKRPEKWRVAPDPGNALASRIVETRYVGDRFEFIADAPIGRLAVVEIRRAPGS